MALALVAGVIAAVCLYRRMDDEIRRRAVAQIAKHYPGLAVTVGAAQLVDGKGVRVSDVVIAEPGSAGPQPELLRIEEMLLECPTDWKQLIQGDLPVRHATIRRPVLRATRRADGTWSATKLMYSSQNASPSPPVTVENGVIEIFDPLKQPASTLTFRDINLTITPCDEAREGVPAGGMAASAAVQGSPQQGRVENGAIGPASPVSGPRVCRLQGMLAGDGIRRIEVDGVLDPRTRGFSIHGRAQGIEVSPELRAALPEELSKRLLSLGEFELRGQADLGFEASYDPAAFVPFKFNVSGQLLRGRVDTRQLPHALTEIRATVRCDNGGVTIEDLTARIGQGSLRLAYRQSGFGPGTPRLITAEVRQLELDRGLWEILPPTLQEQWRKYLPAGSIDADLRLDYDGKTWQPQLTARCLNVAFTHYKFPYRMERGQGTITLSDDRLSLDLTAYIGRRPVRLTANVQHPFSGPVGWFEARGHELAIDEAIVAALPEKSRELVRALDPRGTVNFWMRTWRQRAEEPTHQQLRLGPNGCWVRFERFPYLIGNVRGELEMVDGVWTLRDLEGTNNTATIRCNGSFGPGEQGNALVLNIEARDLVLDEQLRDALSPNVQQVWNSLQPRGLVDLTAEVRYLVAQKKFNVGVRARPQSQTASIEPVHFPYRLDRLDGAIFYRDGHVTMERCKAEHGPVRIAADGFCDLEADGRWRVHLGNLSVDRLRADRELIAALPDRLRRTATTLSLTGLMNLRGSIDLDHRGGPTEPARWQWDLGVGLQQAGLRCGGLSFDNVCGEVSLVGQFDQGRAQSRGELSLDSASFKDCQLTQVRGPIWVDDERVLFGVWVDRRDGGPPPGAIPPRVPRQVTAGLFGGTFYGDGWVTLGPDPHYALNATLTDADLARCEQEVMGGRQRVHGKFIATADLTGNGWSRNALSGRGTIRLSEGNVYELPVMVSLLKLLSVRPPDQSGFSDAAVNYRVEGEHIYFDRIDFRGDAISLRGKGEMDSQSAIRLTFYTLVGRGELDLPVVKQVLRGASQQLILIHVDGTLQEPRTRQEALPALTQALQQLRDELQSRR
ncbi:MAG: AsmA-like C-terminal region-containing protein [Planctomycetaceae bacterium]|nr:AsmA-like C-terminal region-containing protein [Planctomycetaceae bacterium]